MVHWRSSLQQPTQDSPDSATSIPLWLHTPRPLAEQPPPPPSLPAVICLGPKSARQLRAPRSDVVGVVLSLSRVRVYGTPTLMSNRTTRVQHTTPGAVQKVHTHTRVTTAVVESARSLSSRLALQNGKPRTGTRKSCGAGRLGAPGCGLKTSARSAQFVPPGRP